jgi:hypothetical protein
MIGNRQTIYFTREDRKSDDHAIRSDVPHAQVIVRSQEVRAKRML